MGNNGTCPICGGNLYDNNAFSRYACDTCGYVLDYNANAMYDLDGIKINLITVKELPADIDWDYTVEDINHIVQQIVDGDRENACTMYLYEGRLYEKTSE